MQKRKLGVYTTGRANSPLQCSFADRLLPLIAMRHEVERQRTITQILLEIYLMTGFGMLGQDDKISVVGAEIEDERLRIGDQAVHFLPRRLMVNTVSLQNVAFRYSTRLSSQIKVLFERSEYLPVNYQRADSKAELNGMNEAFRRACQSVSVSSPFLIRGQDAGNVEKNAPTFIKSAINIYQSKVSIAFHQAISDLEEKLKGERVFETERERWTTQTAILRCYLKVNGIHQAISEELTAGRIESRFRAYTAYQNSRL